VTVFDFDPAELRRLYLDEGMGIRRLAAHYNCGLATVHRALAHAGIRTRKPAMRVDTCVCGEPALHRRSLCIDCRRKYWREKARAKAAIGPTLRESHREPLYEIRGLDAGGEPVTRFYGAGTIRGDVAPWVARMFERRREVASVELWRSIDPEVTTRDPRRELVETVTRERRAA
jgi:hypothetical protein